MPPQTQFGSTSTYTPILDQLQLTTLAAWRNKLNMALLDRESSVWGMLKDRATDEEGYNIDLKSRIGRANVGAHRGASTINTERQELFAGGKVEWKEYHATVTIDQRTLVQNCNMTVSDVARMQRWGDLRSDSRDKMIDLLGREMEAALVDLQDRLSEDLYADGTPINNEPDRLEGLGSIIEPNTPYAGVGFKDYRRFKRKGKLSGVRNWVHNPLYHDFQNKSARYNHYYSVFHDIHRGKRTGEIWVVMPSGHYDNLSLMLEGQKTRNRRAEELGFDDHVKAINFNATFFPDDFLQGPDGSEEVIYGFQPRHLRMLIHKGDNMTFHQGVIPDNQFTIVFRISHTLAIICDDRARTFKFYNVSP